MPGPPEEVALVRKIFWLASEGATGRGIADELNTAGTPSPRGRQWDQATVLAILRNEKYVGVNVVGRTLSTVGKRVRQPREAWIKAHGAFEALVSQELFDSAQRTRRWRSPPATNEQLIALLREVLADHGRLSFEVIRKDPRTPYPTTYVARFGSLGAVYKLVGYDARRQQQLAMDRARLHRPHLHRTPSGTGVRQPRPTHTSPASEH